MDFTICFVLSVCFAKRGIGVFGKSVNKPTSQPKIARVGKFLFSVGARYCIEKFTKININ